MLVFDGVFDLTFVSVRLTLFSAGPEGKTIKLNEMLAIEFANEDYAAAFVRCLAEAEEQRAAHWNLTDTQLSSRHPVTVIPLVIQ